MTNNEYSDLRKEYRRNRDLSSASPRIYIDLEPKRVPVKERQEYLKEKQDSKKYTIAKFNSYGLNFRTSQDHANNWY